jgi:hypothetical protein
MRINDPRTRAIIDASIANNRNNPAVQSDVQYRPAEWTPEQERELIERLHGTERERIDRLIAEHNEQQRHR